MNAPARHLETQNLQTLIAHGYRHHHCRYIILTVRQAATARRFLQALVTEGWIEPANGRAVGRPAHPTPVSVGLTYPGLCTLGLNERHLGVLQERARAFYEGPHRRAASRLADTGGSAPAYWDPRFHRTAAHVLLAVHGASPAALDLAQRELQELAQGAFDDAGWADPVVANHLKTVPGPGGADRFTVHFGFVDGVSKVGIKGLKERRSDVGAKVHEPGEFFLGYPNDEGYNPWSLSAELPPPHPAPDEVPLADFFRNASFAALRDMRQDEKAFRSYTSKKAQELGVSPEYVQAKMLGRWPGGAVVRPEEQEPPVHTPAPSTIDAFDFSDDAKGLGCPFGSHIRRMNPRTDPVVPFRRRPLIRRGMPYGPAYVEGGEGVEDEKSPPARGLLGLFLCASLEDQFEHLVSEWGDASPMGTRNKGNGKDPIIGNHVNARALLDIPMAGESLRQLDGMTPFITTRGTLYLFFPGLNALALMDNKNVFGP